MVCVPCFCPSCILCPRFFCVAAILALVCVASPAGGTCPEQVGGTGLVELSALDEQSLERSYFASIEDEVRRIQQSPRDPHVDNSFFVATALAPRRWRLIEPTARLQRLFPNERFYAMTITAMKPAYSVVMVHHGDLFYELPSHFNRLMIDHGIEVNDTNILEMAKAYIEIERASKNIRGFNGVKMPDRWITKDGRQKSVPWDSSAPAGFPRVTFTSAKRIKERISGLEYVAEIGVKMGQGMSSACFALDHRDKTQFLTVGVRVPAAKSFRRDQDLFVVDRSALVYGPLIDSGPAIGIDSTTHGMKKRMRGDTACHYLAITKNGAVTGDTVRFCVFRFPRESANVYVRAQFRPGADYAATAYFGRVMLDTTGSGTLNWVPPDTLTGITRVTAGYADTSAACPESTYREATPGNIELTLEKVKTGTLSNGFNYCVHWCDQFFVNYTPGGTGGAATLADRVARAESLAWQRVGNFRNFRDTSLYF